MKNLCCLTGIAWLIILSAHPSLAQTWKDTLNLKSVQIEGKRKSAGYPDRTRIDSLSLARSATIRLSELLSRNTSLYVKEYGRGAMATVSFRGTAPSHTKVTWNGLEINSPMLGMVDFSLVPLYITDEVKLLHGSASLTEAAGALGGTVQLENKADWNKGTSGKLLTGAGSYGTFDEFVQLRFGNRKIRLRTALFYNASANDFTYTNKLNASIDPSTGGYIYPVEKNENADYLNYGLLQEIYTRPALNQELNLKAWLQHNERNIPQLQTNESGEAANLNRQTENVLRTIAEWRRFGVQSKLSAMSAINLQNSLYSLENAVSGAPGQKVIDSNAKMLSFVNKMTFLYQLNGIFTGQAGMEASLYSVDSENKMPTGTVNAYDKNRLENSAFVQLDAKINPKLNALFLLRELILDFEHEALLPLFRLNYLPITGKQLIINGSIAYNSHPPTLNDLYYLPGGNPELQSEKGIQFELNAGNQFAVGTSTLLTKLSLYSSSIRNWIIWLPTFQGYWEPFNLELVKSDGIEANAALNGHYNAIRYSIRANYAFTSTVNRSVESPSYGWQLPYIPRHSSNLNMQLDWSLFHAGWSWSYYSKRYTGTANSSETISDYIYPYFMNDLLLGISCPAGKNKLNAEVRIQNLFNEDYRTVLQRPMPGRNYQFLLSYEF